MRLYPAAPVTGRRAVADDEIGGYRIPAGADVLVSPWVTHRHPQFWDDPERFDPERFTPEREKARHRYAWFPFGGGPRACIGQHFSMLESTIALAGLVENLNSSRPSTNRILQPHHPAPHQGHPRAAGPGKVAATDVLASEDAIAASFCCPGNRGEFTHSSCSLPQQRQPVAQHVSWVFSRAADERPCRPATGSGECIKPPQLRDPAARTRRQPGTPSSNFMFIAGGVLFVGLLMALGIGLVVDADRRPRVVGHGPRHGRRGERLPDGLPHRLRGERPGGQGPGTPARSQTSSSVRR